MLDIAIVGVGGVFPGARNVDQLWQNLVDGVDSTSNARAADLGVEPKRLYHAEPGKTDRLCYLKNGYIRDYQFPEKDFRYSRTQIQTLGTLFQYGIDAADQALSDYKSIARLDKKNCGVVLGNVFGASDESMEYYKPIYDKICDGLLSETIDQISNISKKRSAYDVARYMSAAPAGFSVKSIADNLDLGGPQLCIETACASSLYAISLACHLLRTDRVDAMLAGGLCKPMGLYTANAFNVFRAYPSSGGHSIPFDQKTQGMKSGEGAGFVLLKRYEDAKRDNDDIYAVIENIGLSNDGGGSHILSPFERGQLSAYERAYHNIDSKVDYIECHGTGTPIGDRIEIAALEKYFSKHSHIPLIGGNKMNIGHMLTASGMPSLMKVLFSMRSETIPSTIGINSPISGRLGAFTGEHIVRKNTVWPGVDQSEGQNIKRAGINSFGFGGCNAHMVLRSDDIHVSSTYVFKPAVTPVIQSPPMNLAVIGMAARFGLVSELSSLAYYLREGHVLETNISFEDKLNLRDEDESNDISICGSLIESIDVDCTQYRIPPDQVTVHLFNQMLMTQISEAALLDAGFTPDNISNQTVGVIIAQEFNESSHRYMARMTQPLNLSDRLAEMGVDVNSPEIKQKLAAMTEDLCPQSSFEGLTGGVANLDANRLSHSWQLTGPSFAVAGMENASFKALQIAQLFIEMDIVDIMVVGSMNLGANPEHLYWREDLLQRHEDGIWFGLDSHATGWSVGEAATAVVLMKSSTSSDKPVYAEISGLNIAYVNDKSADADVLSCVTHKQACDTIHQSLKQADITPEYVQYVSVSATGCARQDQLDLSAYKEVYGHDGPPLSNCKSVVGHTFAASGLSSLVTTIVSMCDAHIPPVPEWSMCQYPQFEKLPVLDQITPWPKGKKNACIQSVSQDGSFAHLVIQQSQSHKHIELNNRQNIVSSQPVIKTLWRIEKQTLENQNLRNTFATLKEKYRLVTHDHLDATLKETSSESLNSVVLDSSQINEIACGSLVKLWGEDYQYVDDLPVRIRIPKQPFLFVSEVTRLTAQPGQLEPFEIEWNYDLPADAWFVHMGYPLPLVLFESCHAFLIGLMRIGGKEIFHRHRRYRILEASTEILAYVPKAGQVMQGQMSISQIMHMPEGMMFRMTYECMVANELILRSHINGAMLPFSGDLDQQKTEMSLPTKLFKKKSVSFSPFYSNKVSFSNSDILALRAGDFVTCFAPDNNNVDVNTYLPGALGPDEAAMFDRIIEIDMEKGPCGIGQVIAEVDVDPEHWVFDAHFSDDPVLPAVLILDGVSQTLIFLSYYLGWHLHYPNARPAPQIGKVSSVKFSDEIPPCRETIQYRIYLTDIDTAYTELSASVEIIFKDQVIGIVTNAGIRFEDSTVGVGV